MLFGRPYHQCPEFLFQILEKNFSVKKKISPFKLKLLSWYLIIFGIPDTGFQSRARHFQKIIHNLSFTSVLDAGSGSGVYSDYIRHQYPQVLIDAVDISKKVVNLSRKIFPQINFQQLDIQNLNKKNSYDLICCIDVLEHIENDQKVMENFYRALKKGGKIVIHVPKQKPKIFFPKFIPHDHAQHKRDGYNLADLKGMLNKMGFQIEKIIPTIGPIEEIAWEIHWFFVQKTPLFIQGIFYPLWLLISCLDNFFPFSINKYNGFFIVAKK